MPAIAFTEHGKLSGWVKKKQYCDKKGIKYIHGVEIYVTEQLDPKVRDNYHTVLIARNMDGVREINSIVSKSFDEEHFYYTNRISIDEFLKLSDNVITTSACLASPLNKLPVSHPKYEAMIQRYDYLEIQPHLHQEQIDFNIHLAHLADKYGKKLIAGTDTHSLNEYKAACRKILLKRKRKSYGDEDAFDLTFKTYDELVDAFRSQDALPEFMYMSAIDNTIEMSNMIEDFKLDCDLKYPILYGSREKDHEMLLETIEKKFAEKIANGAITEDQIPKFREAIDEEVRVFTKIHMDGFILSMSELISWCHDNGIATGNARGSVAGSRVAYITDVIDLNPETWHTVFSRFANEDRVEVGDIDTDCIESDRPKIFEYVVGRFGIEKTARVSSYGTINDRGVIDDICGALRLYYKEENPDVEDKDNPYSIEKSNSIKKMYESDPDGTRKKYPDVFYYFDGLLGTKVSQSIHPAGMVISPITLADNYGVFDKDGDMCLMLDMDEVHDVGMVKYDFLILSNIEIIRNTYAMIGKPYPKSHEINWFDQAVWEDMIRCPVGIFQMESDFAFQLLKRFRPTSIFDMSLVTACIRPSGASYREDLISRKTHANPSKMIDEILAENNGYLVYQEDIIKFLQEVCGLTGSEADTVRRGIAKKEMSILENMIPRVLEGYCSKSDKERSVAEREANEFIKIIEDASSYMFGYNHSVAYCLIGYLCAYLRHYHPYEFITCYLNNASSEEDVKNGTELAEIYGIRISPPRYGFSRGNYWFDPDKSVIAKGVSSIRYLSDKAALELYDISKTVKPATFCDLLYSLKTTSVDKRQLDLLMKIDFFEQFGNCRELFVIREMFEFFKEGDAKSIKKDLVIDADVGAIIRKYASSKRKDGKDAASFTFADQDDLKKCINECETLIRSREIPDIEMRVKIQNCQDILGYVDVATGKEEDRRRLLITDCAPLVDKRNGSIWSYRLSTRSLGSGKTSRVSVYANLYDEAPIKKGNIIYAKSVVKNNKGYWYIYDYEIES
jgi:DNA polymerase-3 subunit alpha